MSLLDDLGALLEAAGVATVGQDLYYVVPDTPDAVVVIRETVPLEPLRAMAGSSGGTARMETVRVQIRARATSEKAARDKAFDALNTLDGRSTDVNGTRYHYIAALQRPPFPLGPDATGNRWSYAFNVECQKALST